MTPDLVTEALEFIQHGGRNGAARNDHHVPSQGRDFR